MMAHNVALTDVRISKFNPLPRSLSFDDFNQSFNGWCELVGNHDGDLDNIQPVFSDMRPAQGIENMWIRETVRVIP